MGTFLEPLPLEFTNSYLFLQDLPMRRFHSEPLKRVTPQPEFGRDGGLAEFLWICVQMDTCVKTGQGDSNIAGFWFPYKSSPQEATTIVLKNTRPNPWSKYFLHHGESRWSNCFVRA